MKKILWFFYQIEHDDLPRGIRIVMDEGKNAGFSRARRPAREVALEEIIG